MSVRRSNPTAFKVLAKRVDGIDQKISKAGWYQSAVYEDGTSIAYVASIHEFGVTFTHPGGTPYRIGPDGRAVFVAKDAPGADTLPLTKPHTIIIPARPFMRPTILREQNNWIALMASGFRAVLAGNTTAENVMEAVAARAVGDISKTISEITDPPLKPGTVRARMNALSDTETVGSLTKPLIASGLLFDTLINDGVRVEDKSNDTRQ